MGIFHVLLIMTLAKRVKLQSSRSAVSNHFSHIKRYFSCSYLDASECCILPVFSSSKLYSSYSTVSLVCMLNSMLIDDFLNHQGLLTSNDIFRLYFYTHDQ